MLSAPQIISAKRVYHRYQDGNLLFDEFIKLSQINCRYCGAGPSNTTNWYISCIKGKPNTSQNLIDNGNFTYNGLDRIDNTKSHYTDNVVPCCFNCNRAKNDMNCSYCGDEPSNSYASDRSELLEHRFIYNGLDRLDSTKEHTVDNVIPCWWICNRAKHKQSLVSFNNWLTNINYNWINK
jgi:hypothetical protein